MPTIKHHDEDSSTAFMVLFAFVAVHLRFLIPLLWFSDMPLMTGVEYAAALAAVGGIHVIRENGR